MPWRGVFSYLIINPLRAATELIRFNIVNAMVADAMAPCVASTHDINYRIGKLLSYLRKDFKYLYHVDIKEWHVNIYFCSLWIK